ncbi:hypothetical protein KSP39_PZI017840 [Platanthera zijinensis]|uniref:DUF4216 domain-containing protein n=1 Tax=Platanthera zijinensis TaxID=2320716 RepID=A0AAP0B4J6_9ASPA
MLKANTISYASLKDKNPRIGGVTYYGKLTNIFEIHYTNEFKFILFKCDWINPQVGKKVDEFNFTLVNFNHLLYKHNKLTDEPFILATQAEQVCYVTDPLELDWEVVMQLTIRDSFDMYSKDSSHISRLVPQVEPLSQQELDERVNARDDDVHWVRDGVDGILVDDVQVDVDNAIDDDIIED